MLDIPWPRLLTTIWCAGIFLIVLRIVTNGLAFRRRLKNASPIQSPAVLRTVEDCQRQLGLRSKISVYETETVRSPAIFGILQPRILLPVKVLDAYSPTELTHVILHELAHIKRRDGLWNLWTTMIKVLHWPNPLVWFAVRRIHGDREVAADFLALEKAPSQSPLSYGETILKSLQASRQRSIVPGLIGIAEDRSALRRRFEMISKFESARSYSKFALTWIVPLAIACLTDAQGVGQTNGERQAPKHVIEVLAIDADTGEGLSNIDISYEFLSLSMDTPENKGTTKTDHNGLAKIPVTKPLGPGPVFTLAALPRNGYVSKYRTWDSEPTIWDQLPSTHEFRLTKGVDIGGRIIDESGAPIPDVAVMVSGYSRGKSVDHSENRARLFVPFEAGIKTDQSGHWSCPGAPKTAAAFYLTLRKPNGAEHKLATSALSDGRRSYHNGAPVDAHELFDQTSQVTFPRGKDVEVQIRNQSGQAVQGAKVQELKGIHARKLKATIITEQSGRARFKGRNANELAYVVTHPDYATSHGIATPIDGQHQIEIVLPPKKPLEGTITNAGGEAISDAVIDLSTLANGAFYLHWPATTDQAGRFRWDTAPSGTTFFRVQADNYAAQVFEVSPDQRTVTVTMASPSDAQGEYIARILDEVSLQPIPQFTYSVVSSFGSIDETKPQVGNGIIRHRFNLDHYRNSPAGDRGELFYIIIRAPGYHETISRPISRLEAKSEHSILLRPNPPQHSFKGLQILSPEGNVLSDLAIHLVGNGYSSKPYIPHAMEPRNQHSRRRHIVRPSPGEATFPEAILPVGFRGISILSPSGSLTVLASELDLSAGTLQLNPLGVVEGSFRVDHTPREGLRIGLRLFPTASDLFAGTLYTQTDRNGDFRFENVPAGDYRLFRTNTRIHYFVSPEYYPKDIVVSSGKTTRVDYHLQGHQVRGRFISSSPQETVNWQESKCFLKRIITEQAPILPPRQDQFVTLARYTEAIRKHQRLDHPSPIRQTQLYPVEITPEGEFVASAIPPGRYRLEADILRSLPHSPSGSIRKQLLGHVSLDLAVPQSAAKATIDL